MKGKRIACSFCTKEFVKKTDHQSYCSNACRVKSYRKRHNIPEPDFAKLGGKMGLGDLMSRTWKQEQEQLFRLSQEKIELQKIESMPIEMQIQKLEIAYSKILLHSEYLNSESYREMVKAPQKKLSSHSSYSKFEDYCKDRVRKAIQAKYEAIERKIKDIEHMREVRQGLGKLKVETVQTSNKEGYKVQSLKDDGSIEEIFITNAEKALHVKRSQALQISGEWSDIFGNIASNALILMYGKAGSGKSFYALRFLRYLQKFGAGVFATAEQSIDSASPIVQYAAKLDKSMPLVEIATKSGLEQLLRMNKHQFVVVDSFSRLGYDSNEVVELQKKHKDTCIIGILEATKGGDFKGEESWKHICDVMVEVGRIDDVQGQIMVIKNRYKNNIGHTKGFRYK